MSLSRLLLLMLIVTLLSLSASQTITLVDAQDRSSSSSSSSSSSIVNPLPIMTVQTLNMTFSNAVSGWPTSTKDLASLDDITNTTMCGLLQSYVLNCTAFLTRIDSSRIALHVSVQTFNTSESVRAYRTLKQWSNYTSGPPITTLQTAAEAKLQTTLSALTPEGAIQTMPCRASDVNTFLPICEANEKPVTTIYIQNANGNTEAYFRERICYSGVNCNSVQITVTPSVRNEDGDTLVNITNAQNDLEVVVQYVNDVRTSFLLSKRSTSPWNGNASAGVSASRVRMRHRGLTVTLFDVDEYTQAGESQLQCAMATGMWAFALLAVIPLSLILFRYTWYQGRHMARKEERALIIADEQRLMQNIAENVDPGLPPGMELSMMQQQLQQQQQQQQQQLQPSSEQQWVVDEYGNYYDVSGTEMNGMPQSNADIVEGNNDGTNNTSAIATIPAGNVPPLSLSQLEVELDKQKAVQANAQGFVNDNEFDMHNTIVSGEENTLDNVNHNTETYNVNAGNESQVEYENNNNISANNINNESTNVSINYSNYH